MRWAYTFAVSQASSVDSAFHDARFDLEDCEVEADRLKLKVDLPGVDLELKGYFCLIEEAIRNFEFQGKSVSRKYSQVKTETDRAGSDENIEKSLINLVSVAYICTAVQFADLNTKKLNIIARSTSLLSTPSYVKLVALAAFT